MGDMPSADSIIRDVRGRAALLRKFFDEDGPLLSEEEWDHLVYYGYTHGSQRDAFKAALLQVKKGVDPLDTTGELPAHGRWLMLVYTGQKLTAEWCAGGSRYHKAVLQYMGRNYDPYKIIHQVKGLPDRLEELIAESEMNPEVLRNIAVDEVFEQLGRQMT